MKKLILIPYEKYCRLFSRSDEEQPMETSEKVDKKLSDEDILSLLPEKLREKGKQFLHFLKNVPSIDWDEKGRVIIDGNILNFSHITDFLKDTLQPGKPVEHLETWYEKLSDSVPLTLVHAQRRPCVIKGRNLEKANIQKGSGDQKGQAETNLKDHSSEEPSQELEEPSQELEEPSQQAVQESSQEAVRVQAPVQEPIQKTSQTQNLPQNSSPIQPIVIPPGIPNKSPKKVNFKMKWQTLSI